MILQEAREIADKIRGGLGYGSIGVAVIILDDRIAELELQRDVPRKTLRMLLDILENINIDELRAELAKYSKDLPGFKDIIGLYAEKTEGVAPKKNITGGKP